MIQLTIRHLEHTAKLKVPAEYERVVLALWTLGLDRDPEKYTLRQLSAEFTFDTDEECRMVLLIDQKFTLRYALGLLSQMMFPPYPVAERIHKKMAAGEYSSEEDFFIEMENMVYDSKLHQHYFYFPVSGEVVDKKGLVRKASDKMLLEYEHLICEAIYRVQRQICGSETEMFADVEGVYHKLMGAGWSVESMGEYLVGRVSFFLTEPLTEEEAVAAAEKIEMINSTSFPIRLKHWSVLTDDGLLFAYMCDEDGDYALLAPYDDEDDEDQPCICPECQARLKEQEKP